MKRMTKRRFLHCGVIFLLTIGVISGAGLISQWQNPSEETIQLVSERVLIPGGQSVGIRMNVKGVLIVGLEEIETEEGVMSPGYQAGLQIGDMILSVNGATVEAAEDVEELVGGSGKPVSLEILRKKETRKIELKPVKSADDGRYKLGVWVKERIAGIGTLSFYDPKTNTYAALGHGIYENQTGTLLKAGSGQLLRTEVQSIREGAAGKPGEIRGIFCGDMAPLGDVKCNSEYGIYASGRDLKMMEGQTPVIMASQEQIEEGPAVMLTTIAGSRTEAFNIMIEKVNRQREAGSKGLEITVTDKRLLDYCGGIVQGMSGSPILQNGRLIGVVTHVFVNNPQKGYGIFAEFMVKEGEKAQKTEILH